MLSKKEGRKEKYRTEMKEGDSYVVTVEPESLTSDLVN
jgi:hypothetical protein